MRLLILAALLLSTQATAQTSTKPALPQIRSADNQVTLRAQPVQTVDDNGSKIDPRSPLTVPSTSTAIVLLTAEVFQLVLPASPARRGCLLQNKSDVGTMRVFLGDPAAAAAARAVDVDPGETYSCASPSGLVIADQIAAAGSIANMPIVVVSQ